MGAEPDARHSYQIPHLTDVIALCASAPRVPRLNLGAKSYVIIVLLRITLTGAAAFEKKMAGKHCDVSLKLFLPNPYYTLVYTLQNKTLEFVANS